MNSKKKRSYFMNYDKKDFQKFASDIGLKYYGYANLEDVLKIYTKDEQLIENIVFNISNPELRFNNFYSLKNNNLDLSIVISSYFDYEYYLFAVEYIMKNSDSIGDNTLDIGCDNGIIICYLAKKFPNKKFTGIDKCKESIECAKQLAEKLSLENVQFIALDINDIKESFDTVISSRTFNENYSKYLSNRLFLLDYEKQQQLVTEVNDSYSKSISKIINKSGTLISLERIGKNIMLYGWLKALHNNGLIANLNAFDFNEFYGEGNNFSCAVFKNEDQYFEDADLSIDEFYCKTIMPKEVDESVPIRNSSLGDLKLHLYKNDLIIGYYFTKQNIIMAYIALWTDKRDDGLLCEQFNCETGEYLLCALNGNTRENVIEQIQGIKNTFKNDGYDVKNYACIKPSIEYIMQFSKAKRITKTKKKK